MSSERLQPGMWCRPSSEREWVAVLDLAGALGIRHQDFGTTSREKQPTISHVASLVLPCKDHVQDDGLGVTVPEFISSMYAEAEAMKAPESEFSVFAPKPGEIGFSKEFIGKLDGIAGRLSMIEAAFDEHLRKHRGMTM